MVQKMMTQIFIAAIAFSLSLLAFCVGTWLTVCSGCYTKQYNESSAAKLTGYFVTVLALVSLIFTSYYAARTVSSTDSYTIPTKKVGMKGHRTNHVSNHTQGSSHNR